MFDEYTDHQMDILILHVLANNDPGFGLSAAEITRAIMQIPEQERLDIIARAEEHAE